MPIRYCERHFLKKDGQTPEKFTQRYCGSFIPEANQNSAGSNPEHNLTSKLVLLSAGNWGRWPPEVPSTKIIPILTWAYQKQQQQKKPLTLYIRNVDILTFTKWFPFPDLLLVTISNN